MTFARPPRTRLSDASVIACSISASHRLSQAFSTLLIFVSLAGAACAEAGKLDPTFNGTGKVITDFTGSGGSDRAAAVLIDRSGRILVAGVARGNRTDLTTTDFALARYNPDGSLDTTFGNGTGKVVTDVGGPDFPGDDASAMGVDSQGRIVVVGSSYVVLEGIGAQSKVAIVRFSPDGSLDSTFGNGGKVVTSFGQSSTLNTAHSVAIDNLDRIVVVGDTAVLGIAPPGDTRMDILLARFNPDGSLDTSFGTGGRIRTDFTDVWCPPPASCQASLDHGAAVGIDSAGRIIVAGDSIIGSLARELAIVRYNSDGIVDSTFTNGVGSGRILTHFAASSTNHDYATSLFIRKGGASDRIIVGGYAQDPAFNDNQRVFAFASIINGIISGEGRAILGPGSGEAYGVAWSSVGGQGGQGFGILAGAWREDNAFSDFGLFAFADSGSGDNTFPDSGRIRTNFGGDDAAFAVAIDTQGRIIVAGNSSVNGNYDFAVARYRGVTAADLALTKTASGAALPGQTVTYTIQVSNQGADEAQNVAVSDSLPTSLTFDGCSASNGGSCSAAGNTVTVTFPSLAAGASASITLTAKLNSGVADGVVVTNTAGVAANSPSDPNDDNNSSTASFTVQNKSDLLVMNKANLTSVKAASNLTYTVTVRNDGPYSASGVVISDPVPANSTFVSLNSGGKPCTAPAIGTVGTITCNIGNLDNGASATVSITVKLNGTGNKTSITNTATASCVSFDPNAANNSATVSTQIYGNKK